MRIYIAGPMTGYKKHNWPAFDEAAKHLRARGHTVVSPAELDRDRGYVPPVDGTIDHPTYMGFLKSDVAKLVTCDAIFMLPNWVHSYGARGEYRLACFLEYTVFYYLDQVPILL